MSKLLNRTMKRFMGYAGLVLVISIPVYYYVINMLWHHELDEHKIELTAAAGREDRYLIILFVTLLTVLFFLLLMIGFILLNRRISKRLWQPFYNSLAQIKGFNLDQQQTVNFEETDIEEFSELNSSLNKLIAGNIAVYNQQKEFADNASHELQTPLAVIQSKLDLLLQTKLLTDEQYDLIEDANKALARVTRINKNLLLLTKIENSQFMDKETIDLSELLKNSLVLFSNFSENKNLVFDQDIATGVTIEGNKILVEILLNNLITNAIRYTPNDNTIQITLNHKAMFIANPGTLSLQQEQLFKRFGTTSVETPGTGLGLSLVKQICSRYSWKTDYTFSDMRHIFSVTF
ncbi:sensor histidine kinase [Chitinophaga pinensis]|uniref:histidine kinase n=1 Tax=Chitinophaga pinensis (strain ATCC 43595 / DSM 2588 / LMG 13176 / NBRC 15968 / NCIMB 11800 / UQM 2034) TaxID=485918 RepID=A0A979GRF3_CHIPD|nr:HAMP domain-containing sensor histidine kinase [Chitinophaga pinensis]ACU62317.1 histidine kinase [Chitinophaga pinensis DSM 2588]